MARFRTLIAAIVCCGGAVLLSYGIRWEIDYKKGFDGEIDGKVVSLTQVPKMSYCDVSYLYEVDGAKYTGVSRRDCIFSLFSKTKVQYRSPTPHCSRLASGTSALHASNDDLSSCDSWKTRAKRYCAIVFGVVIAVVGFAVVVISIALPDRKLIPCPDNAHKELPA